MVWNKAVLLFSSVSIVDFEDVDISRDNKLISCCL